MAKAAGKFNLKPKSGIKYLVDKGHIPKEPMEAHVKGITNFLKNTPSLSATEIGKFLGEDKELPVAVLTQYIEEFDFKPRNVGYGAQALVGALKMMLNGFRIPGEGQ